MCGSRGQFERAGKRFSSPTCVQPELPPLLGTPLQVLMRAKQKIPKFALNISTYYLSLSDSVIELLTIDLGT